MFGVERGGELRLGDGDSGGGERVEGGAWVFEGGREVAGVEADADAGARYAAERGDGVGDRFDGAAGFRFEADPDASSGELLECVEAGGERGQGGAGGGGRAGAEGGAPGEGQGGDGSLADVLGEERGEEPGQVGGVGEAFGTGPVGLVDPVLDLVGAEALVGEAVQGDHFEAAAVEFGAQGAERGRVGGQGVGGGACEPEADAETIAAEAAADGLAVVAELGEDAVEGLGRVDVGAVREVDGGAVGVPEAHAGCLIPRRGGGSCPRAGPVGRGGRAGGAR